MTAVLSDNLPFYDDPNEVKPCQWCNRPMVRRKLKKTPSEFRQRKACSISCGHRVKAGVYPGQQWKHLTILYEKEEPNISPNGKINNRWVCQCVCSEKISVRTCHLRSGDVKSCGCLGRIAPSQKFGMLTTVKKGESGKAPNGKGFAIWQCVCDCGVHINVRASSLLRGTTTSCGCKTTTRLEEAVERSLNRLNIYYKREYKPETLAKRGYHYRLDFYLPDYNLNIEADGKDFHGGGNQHRNSEEQIEHDDNRNRRVSWFFGCYILRLSEDLLDGNPKHLDAKLRRFLDDMGEKPQYWLTYDFKTPC